MSTEIKKTELSMSQRFTNTIVKEFVGGSGKVNVTDYQRQLVQGYFVTIDRLLTDQRKDWKDINMPKLAQDLVHYARMGLDMQQDNHVFPILFNNGKTGKIDIKFMLGYNGVAYIAEKYASIKPIAVTTELVYKNDFFLPIKKDNTNSVESYTFKIENPFDRGAVIGGFGYIEYEDTTKNKLIIMTINDFEKRKAKAQTKNIWNDWADEMLLKTLKREVYSAKHMPIDPQKIDDNYRYMQQLEVTEAMQETQAVITNNANQKVIDTTYEDEETVVDEETGEIVEVEILNAEPNIDGPEF